jgi:GNAT superfamily N-acetyltransferase
MRADINARTEKRLNTLHTYYTRHHDTDIDPLDLKHIDREIEDVHTVLTEAAAEANYVREPSIELIRDVAHSYKPFINPDLIRIAREKDTQRPIGFCLVLPDFNQLFKKTKGKYRPLRWFFGRHKIDGARGLMQYVVPDYQNTGLIGAMFSVIYDAFDTYGITRFEAGTMLEENIKAWKTFEKFGGGIAKKYRIFGKDVDTQ